MIYIVEGLDEYGRGKMILGAFSDQVYAENCAERFKDEEYKPYGWDDIKVTPLLVNKNVLDYTIRELEIIGKLWVINARVQDGSKQQAEEM